MTRRYAQDTKVPISRSRQQIEELLAKHGAAQFVSGYSDDVAMVGFALDGRQVRLKLPLPTPDMGTERQVEQMRRQVWRALLLLIKAKLEAIAASVSTLEREFLADIVLPDGRTLGELAAPQIEAAYEVGTMPKLLGS